MSDPYPWLIQWFRDQGKTIDDDPGQLNYFEAGLIDSMEVIGLIGDIEAAFDIHTSWVMPNNFPGYVEEAARVFGRNLARYLRGQELESVVDVELGY